jgi:hypothetical protein
MIELFKSGLFAGMGLGVISYIFSWGITVGLRLFKP